MGLELGTIPFPRYWEQAWEEVPTIACFAAVEIWKHAPSGLA